MTPDIRRHDVGSHEDAQRLCEFCGSCGWQPLGKAIVGAFAALLLLPFTIKAEQTGAAEPLFPDISEIVLCRDDADANAKFGYPRKDGLSAGTLWCYVGKEVKPFSFTDKEGRGGNWYTLISDDSRYELVVKDKPVGTPYCRIWRFDKKPGTLYWVTNNAGGAGFELNPPHGAGPVNLAEPIFGPDPCIASQWDLTFGKIRCQARAGDTNRVNWLVVDANAFSPADFIAKCHGMIKGDLERNLETANGELRSARDNEGLLRRLRAERDKLQFELDKESDNYVKKAEYALRDAVREYEAAKEALERVRYTQYSARDREYHSYAVDKAAKKVAMAKIELEEVKRRRDNKGVERLLGRVQSLDDEIRQLENAPATAQAKVMAIEAEIKALPSVDEARRQWTIHVKVDLGGAKQ